jgi:hypothetical protein
MSSRPYTVELHLSRSREVSSREGVFDLELADRERTSTRSRPGVGIAFLDLRRQTIPGLGLTTGAFLDAFLQGDGGTQEDGLRTEAPGLGKAAAHVRRGGRLSLTRRGQGARVRSSLRVEDGSASVALASSPALLSNMSPCGTDLNRLHRRGLAAIPLVDGIDCHLDVLTRRLNVGHHPVDSGKQFHS